jgi:dGTPase
MNTRSEEKVLADLRLQLEENERLNGSRRATLSRNAARRFHEERLETGYRQAFSTDADRILHSLAYTRYIDKTQVFHLVRNDHITHRVLHVQLVSKIARTIGRFLGLNEDLIEAIALGHDIGHAPFGHDGERFLSALCREHGIGDFHHNVQSIRFLDRVERKGRGWNLTLQTLDGILCHDGEVHNRRLTPQPDKTFDELDREMMDKTFRADVPLMPMTLEGCVVRLADTVSYIGRDLEDAIRLGLLRRDDLPAVCAQTLGRTNGSIVYRLVTDVIVNSCGRAYITFSPAVSDALFQLKLFNLERIYLNPRIKSRLPRIERLFGYLFETLYRDLKEERRSSVIFTGFLDQMSADYIDGHNPYEILRDFIAGMTDRYFLSLCPEKERPEPIVL